MKLNLITYYFTSLLFFLKFVFAQKLYNPEEIAKELSYLSINRNEYVKLDTAQNRYGLNLNTECIKLLGHTNDEYLELKKRNYE